jgi:cyclopropane fatty-acyl-phospholipid synthase-like methyltransferase
LVKPTPTKLTAMNQKVKAGYNKAAKVYSSAFRDQFKNEKYLAELVKRLPKGAHILDIGCGAGRPIDDYLVKNDLKVTGLDISEAQINFARQAVPEAIYIVKDMSEIGFGEYDVDAIVSFYAIFHTSREHHLSLLKVFRSLLKPKGFLLITMGSREWEGKEDDFCGVEMQWSHFGAERNIEMIKKAGFEILISEIDSSGGEEHLVILAKTNP